jgi:PAS domain S-box-containing protein
MPTGLKERALQAFFALRLAYPALAVAYFVSGALGLLLAVPSGYGTAIFPPAGLAVAAALIAGRRTLPWILLGSASLNLYVGYADMHERVGIAAAIALVIAVASTLQASLGGWAFRRAIGYPAALDNARDLTRFFLLTPLVCAASPSLSLGVMWAVAAIPTGEVAVSWLNWWIGDTLGVLIVLPLVMVVAGEPRSLWRKRAMSVALPMALFFALFVAIFVQVSAWETDQSLLEFRLLSQQVVDRIQERLTGQQLFLEQLQRSFIRPAPMSGEIFRGLVQGLLKDISPVAAVEWAPRVPAAERPAFEAAQQQETPGFAVRERAPSGALQSAGERADYYPILYAEPRHDNEVASGFDLGSQPDRRSAIALTMATGSVAASAPLRLVQGPESRTGALLMLGVPSGPNGPGILAVVLRMGIFTQSLLGAASGQLDIELVDRGRNEVLYADISGKRQAPRYERAFTFGSRSYVLRTAPSPRYLARHRGWQSLAVLMTGVLSTGLLGALLLLGSGERHRFARLIEHRTRERDRIWQVSEDMLGVGDFDGRFISLNPAWTRVLGWSESEFKKLQVSELRHPDDITAGEEGRKRLAAGISPVRLENRFRCKDGSYRWISWTMTAEAGRIYVIGRDVTAEREAADTLHRAEEQLRQSQKMEALGQLTGGIAHDFNNLLTVVVGNLEIIEQAAVSGAGALRKAAAAAMTGAMRGATLTRRLLAYAQKQPLNPRAVDLNQLILSMSDLMRQTHGEHISCDYVLAENLGTCFCDANQLETALLNLVINARDAMPEGGKLAIETAAIAVDDAAGRAKDLAPGPYAMLAVRDSGTGMSPETRAAAFEPFFTTKEPGKGTGLGLSMVYGFVKQSHGQVEIDSAIGKGTVVRILLPRLREGKGAEVAPARAGALRNWQSAGETILVVEDDEQVRSFVADLLDELGYHVLLAGDARAALALIGAAARIDLLLTDIVLPGMNGRELAERTAAMRPAIRTLFMTGYSRDVIVHQGQLDPGIEVIEKPFRRDALAARIRTILDTRPGGAGAVGMGGR